MGAETAGAPANTDTEGRIDTHTDIDTEGHMDTEGVLAHMMRTSSQSALNKPSS